MNTAPPTEPHHCLTEKASLATVSTLTASAQARSWRVLERACSSMSSILLQREFWSWFWHLSRSLFLGLSEIWDIYI